MTDVAVAVAAVLALVVSLWSEISKRLDRRTRLRVMTVFDWADDGQTDLRVGVMVENRSHHSVPLDRVAMWDAYRGSDGWLSLRGTVLGPAPHSLVYLLADAYAYAADRETFDRVGEWPKSFSLMGPGGPFYLEAPRSVCFTAGGKRFDSEPGALQFCHDGATSEGYFRPARRGWEPWPFRLARRAGVPVPPERPPWGWIPVSQWSPPPPNGLDYVAKSNWWTWWRLR